MNYPSVSYPEEAFKCAYVTFFSSKRNGLHFLNEATSSHHCLLTVNSVKPQLELQYVNLDCSLHCGGDPNNIKCRKLSFIFPWLITIGFSKC